MATRTIRASQLKQPKVKITPVVIDQVYLGGIGDSPYAGLKNSLTSIVGFDVHSVPGLLIPSQKLTLESGAPTDDLYVIVPASNGIIYYFGKTLGNVWQNSSGTYTKLGTVAPSSGNVGVLDAIEWNGYIYYSMQNYMGRFPVGTWASHTDSWNAFANGQATYHPLLVLNEVLFAGDAQNVAQFDGTTWTNNALVLKAPQIISCLGRLVTDLLIGITFLNNLTQCFVYDWNTWSVSYTVAYPIPEAGVNCFIQAGDADVAVQAGLNGNIYALNTAAFSLVKQIPSNFPTLYSPTAQCITYHTAVTVLKGIPLVAISNETGDPCYEGVYSYGSRSASYPKILTLPFVISTGNLTKITIYSIAVVGLELYVSWFDGNSSTYGIDKLDYNNKYSGAFIETRVLKYSRLWLDLYAKIVVNFQQLPASTAINIYYDANWAGYVEFGSVQGADIMTDTDRNEVVGLLQPRAKTMRYKISTTASGNNAPFIEDALILVE